MAEIQARRLTRRHSDQCVLMAVTMKMWRHVAWYTGTNVSVEPADFRGDHILHSVLFSPAGLLMNPFPSPLLYPRSAYSPTLKIEATGCSETFAAPHQTRRHIPKYRNLQEILAWYCHVWGVVVTNNNGFWIWWLHLLAVVTNSNGFWIWWLDLLAVVTNSYGFWIWWLDLLALKTVDHNSSHIELFLNDACLANLSTLDFRVSVTVTLRLAVYRQSVRLGAQLLEIHGWNFFHNWTPAMSLYNILSDERMGLSFTIAASRSQCIHSRVRVPWDSRSYFIVSDSILAFLSPPTTRRATVEVSYPASALPFIKWPWTWVLGRYQVTDFWLWPHYSDFQPWRHNINCSALI
jgi:hypothetical protein